MYVGLKDLEKAYDRVNREALWQVLRMYDVEGKLLGGIKSMYEEQVDGTHQVFARAREYKSQLGQPSGCI